MKSLQLALALTVTFTYLSKAQNEIDLEVPAYPASTIIGNPGLEINRVGSYSALVGSLISEISPNEASLPTNLALEFTPWYFKSRSGTVENLDRVNILRDLRISLATKKVHVVQGDNSFSRIGMGFRTYLKPGNIEKKAVIEQNILAGLPRRLEKMADSIQRLNSFDPNIISSSQTPFSIDSESQKLILSEIKNIDPNNTFAVAQVIRSLAEKIGTEISNDIGDVNFYDMKNRFGGVLELSGAMALDFPYGNADYQEINRLALWLSYHYLFKNQLDRELSALARFSNFSYDPTSLENDDWYLDIGANFSLPVIENLMATIEYVYRNDVNSNKDEAKANLTLSYTITDQTLFQVTFCKFKGTWETGESDPSQLLLSLVYALQAKESN